MKQYLLPPQFRQNVKSYLDCKICVTRIFHEKKWSMVFHRGVIQLAFLVSSCNRSNIDGHTIRLHITHYSATSFVGHLYTFDGVIFHGHVWYWVLEYDVSRIVVCGGQNKYIVQFILTRGTFLFSLMKGTLDHFISKLILTSATEAWWENNSKEDIENINDRLRRKLELHRYK